ncbi:MAG TPA: putative Ig domain-containing protein [Pyrinomonadaceae bacterium]|nr:putative Ig domain-containing protein [Pyrinomonadaceae bacterium]
MNRQQPPAAKGTPRRAVNSHRNARRVAHALSLLMLLPGLLAGAWLTHGASAVRSHTPPPGAASAMTPSPAQTASSCVAPPFGMVAWLAGDGDADDISGRDNHGTLQNGATYAPGKVGQAFSLDGADDSIIINHSPALMPAAVTIDLWAYPTAYGPRYNRLVEKGGAGATDMGGYGLEFNICQDRTPSCSDSMTKGIVSFVIWLDSVGFVYVDSLNPIPLNQWTHITGVYDGSNLSLYIDGALQGTASAPMGFTTQAVSVGGMLNSTSFNFPGQVDELEIFDRALQQFEIQSIVDAGSAGKCKPPEDADGDGVLDADDNCPSDPNTDQANNDGDAQGDACDPDDDNDTVPDVADNCPLVSNTGQADADGDGQGDACDENNAPALAPVGDHVVDELATLTFTASASDPDVSNNLIYSLLNAPAGASIDSSTGAFSWTPSESQGPGSYTFSVFVSDNGSPAMSDAEVITATVGEVNAAPSLSGVPAAATIDEASAYGFDADAADTDLPAQTLAFSLAGAPAGATIDPATGLFNWTPTEAQGPGAYDFAVVVSDGVTTASQPVSLIVRNVNRAPVLSAIGDKTVSWGDALSFTAAASDPDGADNTLSFSLEGAPAGASINPASGVFNWQPSLSQGPGDYTFNVRVTDDGDPALYDEETVTVKVVDATAPASSAALSETANGAGWHKQNVTVSITAQDPQAGSGVKRVTYTTSGAQSTASPVEVSGAAASLVISAEGLTSVSYFATDNAGNSEPAQVLTIRLDKTSPSISAQRDTPANAAGWNNADVHSSYSASDSLSGLDGSSPATGAHVFTQEGAGQSRAFTVTDLAGNTASATITGVNIDKTAPVVTLSAPQDGAAYLLKQPAAAAYNCSDALSGVGQCAGTAANGGALNTNAVGAFTFTVQAADLAGNVAAAGPNRYTVGFGEVLLYDPTKAHQRGSTIPFKLKITDYYGANYSAPGLAVTALAAVKLSGYAPGDVSALTDATPDENFKLTGDQYHFNLKTTGFTPGTYALIYSVTGDPRTHSAQFQIR